MRRSAVLATLAFVALFALALGVRLGQHHAALLYPDGYQYLLMARGIGEHLQPTTDLGPGGDGFAPSPDAAVKPLYPLLVAAVHAFGLSWLDAARIVTAVAAAAAVTFLALLVSTLSGSRLAGMAAGLVLLASPSLGFWSGFSGPDPLAQALVLAAAVAFVHRRPGLGGMLTGLAISARPETVVLALAAAIVAWRTKGARKDLGRAAPAAMVTVSLVFAVLRTPLMVPDWRLVSLVPVLAVGAWLATVAPSAYLRYAAIAGLGAGGFAILTQPGPSALWRNDWPLLILAAVGVVLLIRDESRSAIAVFVVGASLLLGAVYVLKNPSLERYFSALLPAAAVLVGLSVTSLSRRARPLALGLIAVVVVAGFVRQVPGNRDHDMFSVVAKRVSPTLRSEALVTAAPDAYGFWLPTHTVRTMRAGTRGVILLDAAQRLYEPKLTAKGKVVRRVAGEIAFAHPNGDIDADAAVLVKGRVVVADADLSYRSEPEHLRR
jgi:hypothetical protein